MLWEKAYGTCSLMLFHIHGTDNISKANPSSNSNTSII